MDKLRKIILMTFFGVVLPCLSLAYPDSYIFNNYLQGASPFVGIKDDYNLNENGLWETYKPSLGQSDTILDGIVVSYSDDFMSGSTPKTAVPLVNLSKYGVNAKIVLPAGGCCVVTSDGDFDGFQTSSSIKGLLLGTTSPTDFNPGNYVTSTRFAINTFYSDDSSAGANYPSGSPVDVSNYMHWATSQINSSLVHFYSSNFFNLNLSGVGLNVEQTNFEPYDDTSLVWFLYNDTSSDINMYTNTSTGTTIQLDFVALSSVTWSVFSSSNTSSMNASDVTVGRHAYFFPDVAGDLDIYSFMWSNESSGSYYCFSWSYSSNLRFGTFSQYGTANYYYSPVTFSPIRRCSSYFHVSNSEIEGIDGSNIPIFLNSAVRYIDSTAIMVNGGYININNYEELVALLKENGVGTGDLARVIELLDEINTGGATGAEVKEMIGILENYHNQLIQDGDFNAITNVFDTYKNLLDFSSDMHWLITANNALFSYFVGFIMLCAMFLTLSRIMR